MLRKFTILIAVLFGSAYSTLSFECDANGIFKCSAEETCSVANFHHMDGAVSLVEKESAVLMVLVSAQLEPSAMFQTELAENKLF